MRETVKIRNVGHASSHVNNTAKQRDGEGGIQAGGSGGRWNRERRGRAGRAGRASGAGTRRGSRGQGAGTGAGTDDRHERTEFSEKTKSPPPKMTGYRLEEGCQPQLMTGYRLGVACHFCGRPLNFSKSLPAAILAHELECTTQQGCPDPPITRGHGVY